MTHLTRTLAAALVLAGVSTVAMAQPKPDPDWPCVQRKVPTLTLGSVWSGPDPAGAGEWGRDFQAASLAQRLASRRTPIDETDALIQAFANEAGAERAQRLTRVMAGVHELINAERGKVLGGIERYARGQRRLAERIREEADQVSATRDAVEVKPVKEQAEVEQRFAWDRRIFEDRSQALEYVCETPVLLEQRLFEIARRIQARL
ncbi:hypothetical protein [Salinarimonas soli]|uniref:Secreted protein n=1 Tax=Salinarimonas soli TaxID=1638099 RepID=A0A5B2VFX1_9HYPH|nr:hypothetical protein [Salinarimonas soli]KAA2237518.1 hypothetical protein F0L46_11055 [Salinarimonas soli]